MISSIIVFFFQPRTLLITKSLQPLSKLSDTNVIFKKTNQDPETVLEEYMFILRSGILKSNFYNIFRNNKKLSEDEITNMLIGLREFHKGRCLKLRGVFETMIEKNDY